MKIRAPWLFALIIAGVALLLANKNQPFIGFEEGGILRQVDMFFFRIGIYIIPGMVFAAALFRWSPMRWLAPFMLAIAVVSGVTNIIMGSWQTKVPDSYFSYLIYGLAALTHVGTWALVSLLLIVRFRARWDLFRTAFMILLIAGVVLSATVLPLFSIPSLIKPLQIAQFVLHLLLVSTGVGAAWSFAFRWAPLNSPPADSARVVAMTCPRCDSDIQVRANRAEPCPNCRLKITIDIEDSLCKNCRYPLRGLVGDRCPECGTLIFEAHTPQAVDSPATTVPANRP